MKQLIIGLSLFLVQVYASAQGTTAQYASYEQAMQTIFGSINWSKVPGGMLKERTMVITNWEINKGATTDSLHYINRDSLLELYSELPYCFAVRPAALQRSVLRLRDSLETLSANSSMPQFPLVGMAYQYGTFINNMPQGWFGVNTDSTQLMDYTTASQMPYQSKQLFMAGLPANALPSQFSTKFVPDLFYSNQFSFNNVIVSVDFGNGQGWQQLTAQQSFTVSYPSGQTRARIRLRYKIGTLNLYAYQELPIIENSAALRDPSCFAPDADGTVSAIGANHPYGIWYGCTNGASNHILDKPILIVNGFDPTNDRGFDMGEKTSTSIRNSKDLYRIGNQQAVCDELRAAGYDVVILRYADGNKRVSELQEVVKAMLREIRAQTVSNGSNAEITVIGPSQAAVVCRYALADMERNNENHFVDNFISFDGPMKGAYMPLSMQYYILHLKKSLPVLYLWDFIAGRAGIENPLSLLDEASTKELLVSHYSTLGQPTAEYNQLQAELAVLGYPQRCRNIAISNGSHDSEGQGFGTGDRMFTFGIYTGLFNDLSTGWAIPNSAGIIFQGNSLKIIPKIRFPFVRIKYNNTTVPVINLPHYDGASGGGTNAPGMIADLMDKYPAVDFITSHDVPINQNNFIPTISALDLGGRSVFNSNDLNTNVCATLCNNLYTLDGGHQGYATLLPQGTTPFETFVVCEDNTPHVLGGLNLQVKNFVMEEAMYENRYLQNKNLLNYNVDYKALFNTYIGNNPSGNISQPSSPLKLHHQYYPGDYRVRGTSEVRVKSGESIVITNGTLLAPSGTGFFKASISNMSLCPVDACEVPVQRPAQPPVVETPSEEKSAGYLNNLNGLEPNVFQLTPNPTTGDLQVSFLLPEAQKDCRILIFDTYGRVLYQQSLGDLPEGNSIQNLNIQSLNAGTYQFIFYSQTQSYTQRLLKL